MAVLKFALLACLVLTIADALPAKRADDVVNKEELLAQLEHLGGDLSGEPKISTGLKVDNWTEYSGVNPEELGEYSGGDILFPVEVEEQSDDLTDDDDNEELFGHLEYLGSNLYGEPKNSTGLRVDNWTEESGVNPEELGEYVEGDILFPMEVSARNGLRALSSRWPGGIVYYKINSKFTAQERQAILAAMADYHMYTCIQFKPYTGAEPDFVRIKKGRSGCWSSVGRKTGGQTLNLQTPACIRKKGTIIHELMHTLGFLHEQSRFDRDNYITVNKSNILKKRLHNFNAATNQTTQDFGVSYDYDSVMHYSRTAFSKNGLATLVPKPNPNIQIGQRIGFSPKDISKINKMYKCNVQTP
ncbi:zinc metalloproteinase nas-13-like [Orussus abietinus]|uniref:zinc metalloproteinase nas-13-like n=1 Tax=Orussus abietinus TaxID=222816 RepID=UPI000C715B8D|nr:zinc metalloproteinase nas-13-like [Orussus abietinus]